MNKKLFIICILPFLLLTACINSKIALNNEEEYLDFELEKIQLTKSFQITEPYASFKANSNTDDNKKIELLISLGLLDSSGLKIDKIIKKSNELDIHVTSLLNEENQLAIPQAIVSLDGEKFENLDLVKFNIINSNASPIPIKLNVNEAISKVKSQYQLESVSIPNVELYKDNNNLFWDITYPAIFDKSSNPASLIKFRSIINANSGDILDSNKEFIADPIDSGSIVGYFKDKFISYKKYSKDIKTDKSIEELWVYNIDKGESTLLFTSENTIINVQLSNDLSNISFIDHGEDYSDLYIVPSHSKNAYKVSSELQINPDINTWINKEEILIVEKDKGRSHIYKYNLSSDKLERITSLDKLVSNVKSFNNKFLFTETKDESKNKNIFITENWKEYDKVAQGFNVNFLEENTIIFLEDINNSEDNILKILNLEDKDIILNRRGLIPNYQITKDLRIAYIVKEASSNNYNLKLYNPYTNDEEEISKSLTEKIYLNTSLGKFYLNINSPFNDIEEMFIYPVDKSYSFK